MNDVVLEVEHLVKRYGDGPVVVDDVSFRVRRGRTTALVGESGAGKSTIGGIVTGLQTATSGRVAVCGEDRTRVARSARERRRRGAQLQLVPQDPATTLDRSQRIGDALAEAVALGGTPRTDRLPRVEELATQVGLGPTHLELTPRSLSGGQRQRVAIARALATSPEVIVLDEAVSALDVSVQAQVLNVLNALQRDLGTAYLFITHDLAVVRQVAHDVVVLRHGRVVEHGAVEQVLGDPQDDYTRLLLDSTPRPGWRPVALV
ncbi:ABC transporter ATP-binding protein [Nocardioides mangrovi]|uniref:ATP-binding cassette domain-containing protein n=1 Tax=Nocardioides mangrovi TaxID=2874580 RepID=A0ABS7U8M6_9ACTN|nr:ATP-binding cassette domain-containing protein [Nocardioides mangrovi]MBZ5737091.1 ATP-binding cassette domain-containing protein [Nocardioides mangrovi]